MFDTWKKKDITCRAEVSKCRLLQTSSLDVRLKRHAARTLRDWNQNLTARNDIRGKTSEKRGHDPLTFGYQITQVYPSFINPSHSFWLYIVTQ